MICKKMTTIIVLVICFLFQTLPVEAANWVWVCSSDVVGYYIDKDSIYRDRNYHYYFWGEYRFEDYNYRQKLIQDFSRLDPNTDFSNLYYEIYQSEIYSSYGTIYSRSGNITFYSKNGTVIKVSNEWLPWSATPPGTAEELIFQKVKSYAY